MNPYLGFGPGEDEVQWAALVIAIAGFAVALRRDLVARIAALPSRAVLGALALLAASLSAGYVAHYLRFGPRIVDATHYYLEARALAAGYLAFPVPEPSLAFRGRFLLPDPNGDALGVLFPPGYPAALALAFLAGAPMALGPVLAALLVLATFWLARELRADARVACGAAALSALSAALRYHTADTMSHGFAALLVTVSTAAAARASARSLALSGLCLGWLAATRPVTFAVAIVAALWLARAARWRLAWLGALLAPGFALLLLHQHAVTGAWSRSTQAAYYAVADGPPGCFRYGLGAGIGCLFEHGDFVRARLAAGYGVAEAALNTLRRLGVHALDIANAAPLAAVALFGAWTRRRDARARAAAVLVLGVVVAYAPFYFEGSYPGGGARFFADVLPLEHAFVAIGLAALGALRFGVPVALLGFALHTGAQHALLAEREGGRPMFEPEVLVQHGVERGLVFVATDHGFALGHEPGRLSAVDAVVVARQRNDALDGLVWNALGRPPAYRYEFDASKARAAPRVVAWTPSQASDAAPRIEAENLWPVRRATAGYAHPDFSPAACVSRGRGLRLRGSPGPSEITIDLPLTGQRTFIRLAALDPPPRGLVAYWPDGPDAERSAPVIWEERNGLCVRSGQLGPLPSSGPRWLSLRGLWGGTTLLLDYIDLTGAGPKDVDN